MRILLVEDNEQLGEGIKTLLEQSYAVDHVLNGEDAILAVKSHTYDLAILDLSLPDMDGLDILREIRGNKLSLPVLILTARGKLDDRITGLDRGADDYMAKPFEFSELEARIRALLRRLSMEKTSQLKLGAVQFDLRNNRVTAADIVIELSARETMVLRALMMANGRVLSKAQLLDTITNLEADVSENAIEQYVSRLRKKLHQHGIAINAARGLGYHLSETS